MRGIKSLGYLSNEKFLFFILPVRKRQGYSSKMNSAHFFLTLFIFLIVEFLVSSRFDWPYGSKLPGVTKRNDDLLFSNVD